MKIHGLTGVAAACVLMSTQALADQFTSVTPTGATEALFVGDADTTSSALSNMCIDLKWTVLSTTPTTVTCEAPMSFGQSLMGTLLMGNSYSTPPRQFYRFNVANYQAHSRVQASGWMELQMAFGQMRRTDFSGPTFHNQMMNVLLAYGGQYPAGTSFPNHALVGAEFAKNTGPGAGAMIGTVTEGSPAAEGGLLPGDRLLRVAGEKIKTPNDLYDGLAKGAKMQNFPIEIMRGSKQMTLTLPTRFRPAAGEPHWSDAALAAAKPSPLQSAAQPVSSADELAKFAKLRDTGVITAAEFDVQKQRLLAQ